MLQYALRNLTDKGTIINVNLFPSDFRTPPDQPLITPQTLYLQFINETIAALKDSKNTTDDVFKNRYTNAIEIRNLCDTLTLDATPTPPNSTFKQEELDLYTNILRNTYDEANDKLELSDDDLSKSRTLLRELAQAKLMTQREYDFALTDASTETRLLNSKMDALVAQVPEDPSDPAPPPPPEEKPSSLGFWILGAAALGISATIWFVRKEDLRTRTTTEFKARKW